MNEIIFLVEGAPEAGFIARALGASIAEADDLVSLETNVRDAILCQFDKKDEMPLVFRAHLTRRTSAGNNT